MTKFHISPSSLRGTIAIPPSKSHTLRAILFGLMGKGKTHVRNYLNSPDTFAMVEAIRMCGATVDLNDNEILIKGTDGKLQSAENVIDSGNSGQVLRFIGALAGLSPTYTVITGDHSIRHNRPVKPLLNALTQLGAMADSMRQDGYAPIIIKGPMKPGKVTLPGEDSQPVSGMLIATCFLKGKSEIFVDNPGEKPWIDLTLSWMKRLNLRVDNDNYTHYTVHGNGSYEGFDISVPGDFSSAAFPVAAALVTDSELTLTNIDMSDCQGDKKLIEVLIAMGAKIEIDDQKKQLKVKKGSKLKGMELDINDYIDAITILAVIGCFAEGTTRIVNAAVARKKESDRIRSICIELKKMEASIEETPDGLIVSRSALNGTHLKSYADHRMAMSLSIAALGAKGESVIDGVECVAKTFPTFARDLADLGASIEVKE
ncbi:MAG: 3-phosphoshikimate 1-carboxyvinyltransferase [Verrucomicrobia bacterium]|nr:3-phosphoshikimate 1-carboxyvinyltransferase [Verrucomicrobiota bacterium]